MTIESKSVSDRCTNPMPQVARETKFFIVAPEICGSSVWNLLHITLLAPRIFKMALRFLENLFTLGMICINLSACESYQAAPHFTLQNTTDIYYDEALDPRPQGQSSVQSSDYTSYLYPGNPKFISRTVASSILSDFFVWLLVLLSYINRTAICHDASS